MKNKRGIGFKNLLNLMVMETNGLLVKELSLKEEIEINGGFIGALLGFIAVVGLGADGGLISVAWPFDSLHGRHGLNEYFPSRSIYKRPSVCNALISSGAAHLDSFISHSKLLIPVNQVLNR